MRSASDAFVREVTNGRALTSAQIYLKSGGVLEIEPTDMMQGQLSVSRGSSSASSFDIGSAMMGQLTFSLRNEDRRYNIYKFDDCMVVPYVGALVGEEYEWVPLGIYYVEPIDQYGETLTLTCTDEMRSFERLYSTVRTAYPATLGEIVSDVCKTCHVTLATKTFPNCDYAVKSRNADSKATCLEVIGWAAQAAGCFANMDHLGRLQLRWYDTNAFKPEDGLDGGGFHYEVDSYDGGGFHYDVEDDSSNGGGFIDVRGLTDIKSVKASISTHEVTGLSVTEWRAGSENGQQTLLGADGYVLHVQDNPLIEYNRGSEVAANIWPHVGGMKLTDVEVSMLGTPLLEAGDPVTVTDRHGVTYRFWATNVKWSSTGALNLSCGVKSSSPYVRVDRSRTQQSVSLQTAIDDLWDAVGDIQNQSYGSGYSGGSDSGSGGSDSGSGGWVFQINGVIMTKGTVNFVTSESS